MTEVPIIEKAYRKQSIDLQSESMDWFLYGRSLPHEIVTQMIASIWKTFNGDVERFCVKQLQVWRSVTQIILILIRLFLHISGEAFLEFSVVHLVILWKYSIIASLQKQQMIYSNWLEK